MITLPTAIICTIIGSIITIIPVISNEENTFIFKENDGVIQPTKKMTALAVIGYFFLFLGTTSIILYLSGQ